MKPMKTAPALLVALALTASLAACSGGGTATPGGTGGNPALSETFDWSRASHGPVKRIEFVFPDDLAAIAPEIEDIAAVPVSATALELDSAKYCAVEIKYDYPRGTDTLIGSKAADDGEIARMAAKEAYGELRSYVVDDIEMPEGVDDPDELRSIAEEQVREYFKALNPPTEAELDEAVNQIMTDQYDRVFAEYFDPEKATQSEQQGRTDGQNIFGANARPIDELDSADPEDGSYYSDDLKTRTVVMDCTSDASDPDGAGFSARFAEEDWWAPAGDWFARAEIAVMANGDLLISEAEVYAYQTDSNGDWIAD